MIALTIFYWFVTGLAFFQHVNQITSSSSKVSLAFAFILCMFFGGIAVPATILSKLL